MEAYRPCCYVEYCCEKTAWEKEGMRIKWTEPSVPGNSEVTIHQPLILKLCLECKKPIPMRDVSAWAWTHMYHKDNNDGVYREVELIYQDKSRDWDDWGVTAYVFSTAVVPTHADTYRLTYNVKFRNIMFWANVFQVDHIVQVNQAKLNADHQFLKKFIDSMLECRYSKVSHSIYLGNYMALTLAEDLGFDAAIVLTEDCDNETHYGLLNFARVYVSIYCPPGAGHFIPADRLKIIIEWLRDSTHKYQKILIGDHEGNGYSGSIMTGYIFANNPHLTFEEAYKYVYTRYSVFCHRGLKETLYQLYPRDKKQDVT